MRRRVHYAWFVLANTTLVVFAALGLARFSYTVVLPSMQAGLGLDNTQAGGLATANLVGYSLLAALGGAFASRFGPRIVVTAGLITAGLAMLLTGMADGFASAASWRFVTGLGSGAANVPAMGLLASWFGARRRGMASGVAVAGSSIGLIVLGPLTPRIIEAGGGAGWRVAWFVFGGVVLGLALVSFLVLRDHPSDMGLAPLGGDTRGLYELVPDRQTPPPARGTEELKWGLVYRARAVWHLGLVYTAFGFSYIIYITFFTKYLVEEGGYSAAEAGNLFMIVGWLSLLCGVVWGAVSDVIGRKWALVIVYLIQVVSFAMFDLWAVPTGFVISAVLFGLTAWSIPAIMAAACGDVLGPRLAPAAIGFVTLFFALGQAAAPTVAGVLADGGGSFGPAFLLAAGVSLLGAVFASLLRPTARAGAEEQA
ncbi:MAG: MFS transporter [Thermoleophilia bacterium]